MSSLFIFDNVTIAIGLVLLVVALLSAFMNPFVRFKKPKDDAAREDSASYEPLSVILTPHDEVERLESTVRSLLAQDYPAPFQIIVVVEEGDHDTDDALKRIVYENNGRELPNNSYEISNEEASKASVYITYIPKTSRYMSRKKLAITIGVKAARTEWLVLTEAGCLKSSDKWLRTMADHCDAEAHLVIGYGAYEAEASAFKRFERLHSSYYLMREDAKGMAYRTLSHNLMFRKSDFMAEDGFLGNLNLIRGEYDFIVNKYAVKGGTRLVTDRAAWMIDEAPARKTWLNSHIFYIATRKWLSRSFAHRLLYDADQMLLHLNLLLIIVVAVYSLLTMKMALSCLALAAFLLTVILRSSIGYRAARAFGERIPVLAIYPLELSLAWHALGYFIRYRLADKLDFTTHKQ